MTALTIIWGITVVPAFGIFSFYAMRWAYEDLGEDNVTNNDKLGVYAMAGLFALAWPLLVALLTVKLVNDYIDGRHVS